MGVNTNYWLRTPMGAFAAKGGQTRGLNPPELIAIFLTLFINQGD